MHKRAAQNWAIENRRIQISPKLLVRKGGVEPPWVSPPDPKFAAHEESMTYTQCDQVRPSATNATSSKAFRRYRDTRSRLVGFGGGHKTGHNDFGVPGWLQAPGVSRGGIEPPRVALGRQSATVLALTLEWGSIGHQPSTATQLHTIRLVSYRLSSS
jgi:hypothetical protein